jgi:hypothetical protein
VESGILRDRRLAHDLTERLTTELRFGVRRHEHVREPADVDLIAGGKGRRRGCGGQTLT